MAGSAVSLASAVRELKLKKILLVAASVPISTSVPSRGNSH